MPYTPTTWTEGVTKLGPTNMNHLETGVSGATTTADAAIAKPASPALNDALVWNGSTWTNAKLVDANIAAGAAIVYSKLSLAGGIVNNDISGSAAILASKLASYPTDGTKFLAGDGTWKAASATTYRKTTAKTVNTTVSATDLLNAEITIAAGVMGATGEMRLHAWGDGVQNVAGTPAPPRFQLIFGGTTIFDTGVGGLIVAQSATRFGWEIRAELLNLTSATQDCHIWGQSFYPGGTGAAAGAAFTTGAGWYWSPGSFPTNFEGHTTSSLDTATSKTLVLNVINGNSGATYETKLTGAVVEIV